MSILSIITINLNNAIGLAKTIKSVVNQTYINKIQFIIIDGGSTDESIEVIKAYEHKISYWLSESDNGIYQAMNKGIKLSTGQYCQFLNSGDYLSADNVIERVFLKSLNSSIIIGNLLKISNNNCIIRDIGTVTNISMLTLYKGTLNHSSAFLKRSLFFDYGFYDEALKIVSDWKFYLIAVGLHNVSVSYINIDVSYFDTNGISNSSPNLLLSERRTVLEEIIPDLILRDYDNYALDIERINRIKRFPLLDRLLWFFDRIAFKHDKWMGS